MVGHSDVGSLSSSDISSSVSSGSTSNSEVSYSQAESRFAQANGSIESSKAKTSDIGGVKSASDVNSKSSYDLSFAEKDDPNMSEIAERAGRHYEKAEQFSQDTGCFKDYSEHKASHIEKVYNKTDSAAEEFSKSEPMPEGYARLTDEDRSTLKSAALYHDTGMDGNTDNLEAILKADGMSDDEIKKAMEPENLEKTVRSNHGENAALNVLADRECFERAGVDPDQAAVDCALHSKSGSGITDLKSQEQWDSFINHLNESASNRGVEFDVSKFAEKGDDGKWHMTDEGRERCSSHGYCIRVGDANGHDMTDNELQDGSERVIDREGFKSGDSAAEEAANNRVEIRRPDGSVEQVESDIGKNYAMGEGNIRSMDIRNEGGVMVEHIEVDDGSFAPESTIMCIDERAGELATANGVESRISIDVDASNMDSDEIAEARERYEAGAERIEERTSDPEKCAQPIEVEVHFYDSDGNEV